MNERNEELLGEWYFQPVFGAAEWPVAPPEAISKRNELREQLWAKYPRSEYPDLYPMVQIVCQKTESGNTIFIVGYQLLPKTSSNPI